MKKEPKLADFICHPTKLSENRIMWHNESIKNDIINNETAQIFYKQFGNELYEGVQKYYDNQDSLQEFIEILSEKASVNPAIDIHYEDQQKPIKVITEQQLIQWRKDKFWRKNIENIINLLFAQAHDIYHIQKNKYDEDLKYYNTLSEEEKKDYDKEEDYGLR